MFRVAGWFLLGLLGASYIDAFVASGALAVTGAEAPLVARTFTRFVDPEGSVFEFQLDGQGKVTGATLEQQGPQGPQRIPLERK